MNTIGTVSIVGAVALTIITPTSIEPSAMLSYALAGSLFLTGRMIKVKNT